MPPNLLVCSPTPLRYDPLSVHASLLCSWDQLYTPTTRYDPPLCVSALRHQSLCVCILVGSALHVWPHQSVAPSICLCTFLFLTSLFVNTLPLCPLTQLCTLFRHFFSVQLYTLIPPSSGPPLCLGTLALPVGSALQSDPTEVCPLSIY